MSASTAIMAQQAAETNNYNAMLADLLKQDQTINAKFGTNAQGQLDFINPQDPFSVTGAAKRLFREQREYGVNAAASQGGLYDGATSEESAKLGVRQSQHQREITDQFNEAHSGVNSQRVNAEGNYRSASASLASQLADAFASDQQATLGAAAPVNAPAAPAAAAPANPGLEVWTKGTYKGKQAKNVNGKWYYMTASGKWAPIPGL